MSIKASMKRARLASSAVSVNTSSNWSTITSGERALELRDWICAGRHHHDGPLPRPAVRRDEAGTDEGGLAAPRRAHQRHEAALEEPVEDGSHDLLSSEEEVAVLGPESHETAIGARLRSYR